MKRHHCILQHLQKPTISALFEPGEPSSACLPSSIPVVANFLPQAHRRLCVSSSGAKARIDQLERFFTD
jgi:hypothetical protein